MLLDLHGDIWTDVTVQRLQGMKSVIKDRHLDRFRLGGLTGGSLSSGLTRLMTKDPRNA